MSARERTTFGQRRTLGHQLAPLDTWGTRHMMRPDEAANVQRALSRVPEKERIVLQLLYVPHRWPAHVMLARAKIPARLSQERHLAGLRMFCNIYLRLGHMSGRVHAI